MNIWPRLDELLDESTDLAGIQAHGLDLYAARRWRVTGRTVPDEFRAHERAVAMATLSVTPLLAQIRNVLDGPILLLKGPEVASRYPDPGLRSFGDLDLLVRDSDTAQRQLIAAGWSEAPGFASNHRPPLRRSGSILQLEIHARPKWPGWTTATVDDLFSSMVPSALEIDGFHTVARSYHAVLLAAHSWAHEPFRRALDLVDIALMSEDLDPAVLENVARAWGLGPVWHATTRAIAALLYGDGAANPMERLLTSHLLELRERTVLESRIACWTAGCWAPTPTAIARALPTRVLQDLRPWPDESWNRKLRRAGKVLQHTFRPNSECPFV